MIKSPALPCGLSYRRAMPARPRPPSGGAIRLKRRSVHAGAGAVIAASWIGRRSAVALMLLACLLIAGCAQTDRDSADRDQPGGFYSGVSGGLTR
jgi:hypothetical protein